MYKKILLGILILIIVTILGVYAFSQSHRLLNAVNTSWNTISLSDNLAKSWNVRPTFVEDEQSATFELGSWQVVFSKNKDQNDQIRALQEVATRLRMDTTQHKLIDLRFSKVVIRDL